MKLDINIKKAITNIKKTTGNSPDLITRTINKKNYKIACIFFDTISSSNTISDYLIKPIIKVKEKKIFESVYKLIKNNIANCNISSFNTYEELFYYLSCGFTIILIDGISKALAVETRAKLDRGIVESTSEPIIRGPKDSFTENHNINIGLIRKRIKDTNLFFKDIIIGRRTKTKVTISYINGITPKYKVDEIIKQLKKIDIDGILDSGYIRELIENSQKSLFPKVISTERPDVVCNSLLDGKITILVENTPFVIILPATLTDFFNSPEDNYRKPFNASFSRMLRIVCFILALTTPAFYISVMTFNHELIPDQLLISLAIQRDGVPFPTAIEVLIFVITFELLREADIHAPSFSGSAMNIVGALILGDAAVAAGIVSPIVIIVVATTSICELVFYDVDVIDALREWRIFFIIAASLMGIIGMVLAFIIFIAKLSSLETLGTDYLSPISPLNINGLKSNFIRVHRKLLKYRPSYLTKNNKRMDDNYEKNIK